MLDSDPDCTKVSTPFAAFEVLAIISNVCPVPCAYVGEMVRVRPGGFQVTVTLFVIVVPSSTSVAVIVSVPGWLLVAVGWYW